MSRSRLRPNSVRGRPSGCGSLRALQCVARPDVLDRPVAITVLGNVDGAIRAGNSILALLTN